MSLSIYEFVVQPILRRLSRSSNDSDDPRITPQPSGSNGATSLNQEDAALEDVSDLANGEYGARTTHLLRFLWDPRIRPQSSPPRTTLLSDSEDRSANAPAELTFDTGNNVADVITGPEATEVTEAQPAPANDVTSRNPSHGVPHSLRSPSSSVSSSIPSNQNAEMAPAEDTATTGQSQQGREGGGNDYDAQATEGTLPADDGMRVLRKRILEIQKAGGSQEDKSRRMHALMTEQYNSSQPSLHSPRLRSHSPASFISHERPITPRSTTSVSLTQPATSPPTSLSSTAHAPLTFNLSAEDRKATFYTKNQAFHPHLSLENSIAESSEETSSLDEDAKPLGCAHYKRNIKLQCSACECWYTCRFCHDEVEDHSLNRRETKYMLCMFCGMAQKATDICINCGERAASYFCEICRLWDDDTTRNIYHCPDCGICRVGEGLGKDFFHCKTCCVCLSIRMADSHRCIERSTDCDCPICGEYLFTSPQTVVFMQCGHSIHHECYKEHMKSSYRCPICSRSVVNMEIQFDNLQRQIDLQPMPPQFRETKAMVYCNDCCAKTTVKYHWLGTRCEVCKSFNTAQIKITGGPDMDALPIEALESMEGLGVRREVAGPASRPPSRPPSRGRSTQLMALSRRSGTSASVMGASHHTGVHRATRSASPGMPSRTSQHTSSGSLDSMNLEDDELDEVNILGMHSPPDRDMSGSLHASSEDEDGEDEEGSTDENDEDMNDDPGSDDGDGLDPMEIQGHW